MPRVGARGGAIAGRRSSKGASLTLRVELGSHARLGPGKIKLMELIERCGSIAAAGRAMNMSYRRAWLLVDELNQVFRRPLVATHHGGAGGGKAELTVFGREIVRRYRAMENAAERTAARHLRALARALTTARPSAANVAGGGRS
jgi:molybdate transport system regulatory protein